MVREYIDPNNPFRMEVIKETSSSYSDGFQIREDIYNIAIFTTGKREEIGHINYKKTYVYQNGTLIDCYDNIGSFALEHDNGVITGFRPENKQHILKLDLNKIQEHGGIEKIIELTRQSNIAALNRVQMLISDTYKTVRDLKAKKGYLI